MTHRSILAGKTPNVVVRAGGEVQVEGWDDDRVLASTDSRWGLKVEQKSESEIARVRARIGDRVLFDMHLDVGSRTQKQVRGVVVELEIGGRGRVYVPLGSNVKVYAGQSVQVRDIRGRVAVYAGRDAQIRKIHTLIHASAGHAMDLDCDNLAGDDVKVTAGRDLRIHVRDLTDVRVMVDDLGGYWEGLIGDGHRKLRLKAGGDVTLVTEQEVRGRPPDYVLGRIEKPARGGNETTPPSETSGT